MLFLRSPFLRPLTKPFLVALLLQVAAGASPVLCDEIVTNATPAVRIESANVQTIRSGSIYYLSAAGGLETIAVADVASIIFPSHETQLRDVARLRAAGDLDAAVVKLMTVVRDDTSPVHKLWLHAELAMLHQELGENIEAAGHFAYVAETDDDPVWLRLAPESVDVTRATFHTAGEAVYYLRKAERKADEPATLERIQLLLSQIEPAYEKFSADGRSYRGGSTISGVMLADVGTPRPERQLEPPPAQPSGDDTPNDTDDVGTQATPGQPRQTGSPDSPEAIDALLEAGSFTQAVQVCRRLLQSPGDRDIAQFLYQYGTALRGAGQQLDAAVMLARCAIERPGSRYAPRAWIEVALIYRDVFHKPAKARTLLELAAREADAMGDAETAERARALAKELNDTDQPR
ncbi:MAG: tetratricopeptide repeat protein [Phycisphaerales bacterium]